MVPPTWRLLGWSYDLQGRVVGLIPSEALSTLLARGEIDARTIVWKIWEDENGRRHVLQTQAGAAIDPLDGDDLWPTRARHHFGSMSPRHLLQQLRGS